MNKTDKLIVALLALVLVGWVWYSFDQQKKSAQENARRAQGGAQFIASENTTGDAMNCVPPKMSPAAPSENTPPVPGGTQFSTSDNPPPAPRAPEQTVVLTNGEIEVTLSSRGAAVTKARLLKYTEKPGAAAEGNPPVTLDFAAHPALALAGVPGMAADADFAVAAQDGASVVFTNAFLSRTVTLADGYRLKVQEAFAAACPRDAATALSVGVMAMGASKNDLLSVDSMSMPDAKDRRRAVHHGDDGVLKSYLAGGLGGCGGKRDATGLPAVSTVDVPGGCEWLAVKNRFFVTAVTGLAGDAGFAATVARDTRRRDYAPRSVAAAVKSTALPAAREYVLYVGPKSLPLLWGLGLRDVMEFGMWRWLCYPMVWILNFFDSLIPNYGVAIILLTVLVRLVFWPLTHKSTVGMRRMQEIQPLMKEIQAKYKDNPQRMQQETWALYREHKVNPMSSCLPMLIQIPVFIALFNVLRSTVELRYAPFLWIADLSEPEGLFASWFPFGGLNILPILMAATMALQSALTPSAGDKNQQRMMMVMMPLMMLVMFYSFPSALSLYWTLSQVFSIVQMWWIRKKYTPAPSAAISPDSVEMPRTRQMRRHDADRSH